MAGENGFVLPIGPAHDCYRAGVRIADLSCVGRGFWAGIVLFLACWAPHRQSSLVRLWTAMGVILTWGVLFFDGPMQLEENKAPSGVISRTLLTSHPFAGFGEGKKKKPPASYITNYTLNPVIIRAR
ncbi:hypothetical protein J3F83DRAFT_743958 [Trichoderma novae-zelandiae]